MDFPWHGALSIMTIFSRKQFLYLTLVFLILLMVACGDRSQGIREMTGEKLKDIAEKLADEGTSVPVSTSGIKPVVTPATPSLPSPTTAPVQLTTAPTGAPVSSVTPVPARKDAINSAPTSIPAPAASHTPTPTRSTNLSKIAFTSFRDGNSEIYVMNSDGTSQIRLTTDPASDDNPAWSPDGTKIAFDSTRMRNTDIYVMNSDGTGRIRLTDNLSDDSSPAWSPDGTKIAFYSYRDGNGEVYVMNSDGTSQIRLTTDSASDDNPAWSPDGTKIAFMSQRHGNFDVFVMWADGAGETRLTDDPADDSFPAWSPDGTKIAFMSLRNGNPEVYVMLADGAGETQLTDGPAANWHPSWSPDGKRIAFVTNRHGNTEIYANNADGTGETRLTDDPAWVSAPSWSRSSIISPFPQIGAQVPQTPHPTPELLAASLAHLQPTAKLLWNKHMSGKLAESHFTLHVSKDHFPLYSKPRSEIDAAVRLFNSTAHGSDVSIKTASTEHKSIDALYEENPTRNYMDYVDNADQGFPCHGAGDFNWSMNTCKYHETAGWGSRGKVKYFNIAANCRRKAHCHDPEANDYPRFANISHELAHGFGMKHTKYWPETDRKFISTMQGNLNILSSYDVAFLRNFYPDLAFDEEYIDFLVSPVIRVKSSISRFHHSNHEFSKKNPNEIYLIDGTFYDCKTQDGPIFHAAWFNTGTEGGNVNIINRFSIGPAGDEDFGEKVTIQEFKASGMPALSQDQWSGQPSMTASGLTNLEFDKMYALTFELDVMDHYEERSEENNSISADIILRRDYDKCT